MKRIVLALVMTVITLSTSAQLLYRISGHGLKSPSYIVGTYHLANVSFVDSIPGVRQAMADCQQVYGELVMSDVLGPDSVALMEKAMMLPDGMTLNNLLSADEMSRLNAYLKELVGMDLTNPLLAQQMGKLSPAALNTALSVLSFVKKGGNVDVQNGFDDYFQKEALAQGKGVGGLETMAFQVETLFKGTPLERQKELLMCLVDNAAFMDEMDDRIVNAFYSQNLDAIQEAMDLKLHNSCDSSPEEEDKLIYNRNANWLKKMPALMTQKSTLFAVGAGHLPGEKGMLNLLRKAGYTVEGVTAVPMVQPLLRTHVETGDIEGIAEGALAVYKAIPYAAPPVGNLRWKEPQPAKSWEGVLKAETFGPWPPQPTRPGRTADMMSEDCLYLGIATPATSVNDRLPVMVWIHGGGFQTEHYGGDLWKHLAQRGVVVVSVEYRTGALGFMAHPELTKESKEGHSGNYGLLDQIYALKWVQRNIQNFGGDPSKVTIFGESAGAISCSILCASPLAKGLFRAAISQSGGSFAPWSDNARSLIVGASQKGAEQQGLAFQKHLKKKSLKELRKMDAMALCGSDVGFGGFWPCVDNYVITDDLYRLYERGEYNDVPVIVMTNSDEGALFSRSINPEDYQKSVRTLFGPFADEALKLYPGNTVDEAFRGNGDAFRDLGFAWPSYAWVSLQSKTGKSPAYAAFLAQPSTRSFSADPRRHGVAHADDILYLNGEFLTQPDKYPAESAVSEIMQQYWVNFAKTCNPNAKGLPYWPTFDASKPTTMQFSNGASLIMLPNRENMEFVDRFYRWVREETEKQRK